MPKTTGTNIEALQAMFVRQKTLTPEQVKNEFPHSTPSTMVWHLKYKKGMVIEAVKDGRKISKFIYIPNQTGVIIDGSKKAHDARLKETESR